MENVWIHKFRSEHCRTPNFVVCSTKRSIGSFVVSPVFVTIGNFKIQPGSPGGYKQSKSARSSGFSRVAWSSSGGIMSNPFSSNQETRLPTISHQHGNGNFGNFDIGTDHLTSSR